MAGSHHVSASDASPVLAEPAESTLRTSSSILFDLANISVQWQKLPIIASHSGEGIRGLDNDWVIHYRHDCNVKKLNRAAA